MSGIFNRQLLKFVAALSVPLVLIWLFIYCQQEASREVRQYQDATKVNPVSKNVTVKNYELKEVDDHNHIRWQLVAKSGVLDAYKQTVALNGVKVEYYDGKTIKMRLTAPAGEADEATRYVKLSGTGGTKVTAEGENGKARLEAPLVELTKNNQFAASGGVTIVWPQVAKVSGDSASGTLDFSDKTDFKIVGNTHAQIVVN